MTSSEIRQAFLDFFKSKGHTIVPSASLLPDSPNLLFTNAGMNQFVPIFLGQRAPDVSKWPGAVPGSDTRAADTQKCIRAGGKHNDLEDVGLDTYHLTFFEMLGNWSFGDYFKKESLTWGWELLTKVWGIPPKRLFATVYAPDKSKGDPAEFDQEAADVWTEIFRKEGLDPSIHIVHGGKKDNFWMMGDTGPCGPCSEIHFNLLLSDDEHAARALVNVGAERCIEIWNHVFIQFNANPDGTYSLLPSKHVDTGMGFDRIAGFYAGTRGFKEFSDLPSAYDTDIFSTIFAELEKLSGKKYKGTLPKPGTPGDSDQEKIDIAFRVIADHIRTLGCAIADGIIPSNEGRGYVLRRILRRAVRYGRILGFHEPFFYKLVSVLAETMGHVFSEIRYKHEHVEEVIEREERAFNKTLDMGIGIFSSIVQLLAKLQRAGSHIQVEFSKLAQGEFNKANSRFEDLTDLAFSKNRLFEEYGTTFQRSVINQAFGILARLQTAGIGAPMGEISSSEIQAVRNALPILLDSAKQISGDSAFLLYDTYGFPPDLTELMARELGLTVDIAGFNKLMEEQKARARAAQKRQVIELSQVESATPTQFIGYDQFESPAKVLEVLDSKDQTAVILDTSPLYAEMGGQVGDTGNMLGGGQLWRVVDTRKTGFAWLHFLGADGTRNTEHAAPSIGSMVTLSVDKSRRESIQRHHTVTHLLHWALHELVSKDAVQKGSYVGPDKLTFDFSSAPLTPQQLKDIELLVNERILENAPVSWTEVKYRDIKERKDIMQFFGEKYGDDVRVVQIGGKPQALDGYSMELCGGTHTRATGELGLFRIVGESAIAAGVRRIEAVSGLEAYRLANDELQLIKSLSSKVNTPISELEKKIEALLVQQKELEKQFKAANQKQAAEMARSLLAKTQTVGSTQAIVENIAHADAEFLQNIVDALKAQFKGVIILGGASKEAVTFIASVSPELTKSFQAGKIIQTIAPIVGGKGGGRPDNARGGGKDVAKLDEALAAARKLLG